MPPRRKIEMRWKKHEKQAKIARTNDFAFCSQSNFTRLSGVGQRNSLSELIRCCDAPDAGPIHAEPCRFRCRP